MLQTVDQDFVNLLITLSQVENKNFCGAGFVLYQNLDQLSKYHCSLVQNVETMPTYKLGTNDIISYLIEISHYRHPLHDGFHFINSNGFLTHVAQFFSPPINKCIESLPGQGARTFCSQCGSTLEGVMMVGAISSKKHIYLFEKGVLINEKFKLTESELLV